MRYQTVLNDMFHENLYAGSHPAGFGENQAENITIMSDLGINIIYSFEKNRASDITPFWRSPTKEHKLKVGTTKITVVDFNAPSINQLTAFVSNVIEELGKGKKVFLHCRQGLGRTGTFLAALYLSKTDCTVDEAIKKIRQTYQPHAIESDEQIESLHLYKASLENMFFGLQNF